MPVFEQQTFEKTTVRIDGQHYKACEFRECVLDFRGGPVQFDQCHFIGCTIQVDNPGLNVLRFLRIMHNVYPEGPGMVETLLDSAVRRPLG